jgi:hypothetical protein
VSTEPVGGESVTTEAADPGDVPVDVRLLRYPLRLAQRATEHYDEVFREFALLAGDRPGDDHDDVPARLLRLVDLLGRRYRPQQEHEALRAAALSRGETQGDFVITVPASAADASAALGAMLDEADDFCSDGTLLTLAAPPDVAAFRRWYLQQVIEQVAGRPAQPWPGDLG